MASTASTVISSSDLIATTSYGAIHSGEIHVGAAVMLGLGFKIDTAPSVTGLTFKVQTKMNTAGDWIDLYRDNSGTFEIEEYTIPLTASATDLLRAIRLSTDGIRHLRLLFKGAGGNVTINTIDGVYERPTVPVVDD